MTRLPKIVALACAALAGCYPYDDLGTSEQPLVGAPGLSPNPLTFWWHAGDAQQLRPALECALTRIRNATCLPVDVSFDAHHWVRQKPAAEMGGRLGWTTGSSYDETRIALKTVMGPNTNCRVLTHEIAQHVLQRRNDDGHVSPLPQLSAELIERICVTQEARGNPCGCFNPESEDNPIPAAEYGWVCTGLDQ